ncbi:MAG: MoaD/ThiS family protein [Candidatus Poseidoniaceae archaeon]|jgi:molybdopterin converting factor small subunit|nr:MoaD/ThiS family protein [Candidatus Poseidoniaceae archaeon]
MVMVEVICFGPLAEKVGWRSKTINISPPISPSEIAEQLGLQLWVSHGLTYHIDGKMVTADEQIVADCELALLPPVSGG